MTQINNNALHCPKIFQAQVVLTRISAVAASNLDRAKRSRSLLSCAICEKGFLSRANVLAHEVSHMDGKKFKCPYNPCTVKARFKLNLRKHVLRIHKKLKPHRCAVCRKSFATGVELRGHSTVHLTAKPEIICANCGNKYSSQRSLQVHKFRCQSGGNQKTKKCEECGKTFWTRAELRNHRRSHTGEKPCVCPICNSSFALSSTLTKHIRAKHTGEKTHECGSCLKRFVTGTELRKHSETHLSDEDRIALLIPCDFCSKRFISNQNKQAHMRNYHRFGSTESAHLRSFGCSECGKMYKTKGSLVEHKMKHLPAGRRPAFVCVTCSKSFGTRAGLALHKSVHTGDRPHTCAYCCKKFRQNADMAKHIAYKHTKERPIQCTECRKDFVSAGDLRKHSRAVHLSSTNSKRPMMCDCEQCGKKFANRSSLAMHKKRKHETDEAKKTHSCGFNGCNWRFLTATELRSHIRKHSEEKPFGCQFCSSSFTLNGARASHVRRVHTQERSHKCGASGCGKDFVTTAELRAHFLVHIDVQERERYDCHDCGKRFFSKWAKDKHIHRVHLNETPYSCDECDFASAYPGNLRRHNAQVHKQTINN